MIHTFATFLTLLLSSSLCSANDWPSWGGPNGDLTLHHPGMLEPDQSYDLRIVWKKTLGTGYSAVSIRDGRAVTAYSDGTSDFVVAFDAETGSRLWEHTIGPTYLGHYGSQSGPLSTAILTADLVVGFGPRGKLFALHVKTGELKWEVDLASSHGAIAPFWGFTSSPKLYGNSILVQTGGTEDNALAAFDLQSGQHLWSALSDSVGYQTPTLDLSGETDQVLFHGNRTLAGLDPTTGRMLWSFDHGGQTGAGATSGHPIRIADGRYFIKNGPGGVMVAARKTEEGSYVAEEVWRSRHIRGTYIYPIYHDGVLFGYNRRILTAVDAETGERLWRSREPGDGLTLILNGHLVIITKEGRLSIAPANREGYTEIAGLRLFDDIVWSPVSFANGKLYARSMGEIACVEIVPRSVERAEGGPVAGIVPNSQFARFLAQVEASAGKSTHIDQFFAGQKTFPILEGDSLVHFVYRGEGDVVTMTGDHVGRRIEKPLHRVSDTDLHYYSMHLEPDARITYHFTRNLTETLIDSLSPRPSFRSLSYGQASWFAMPKWRSPDHLEPRTDGVHGRIDTLAFAVSAGDEPRSIQIYLPPSYEHGNDRYPVVYLHGPRRPFRLGKLDVSLDNLIGERVRPVIVVFLPSLFRGGYRQYVSDHRDQYRDLFVDRVVPLIDDTYRTVASRDGRANGGSVYAGFAAFYATFTRPDLFGGLAIQTMNWDQTVDAAFETFIPAATSLPSLRIYLDWGKYDLRSPAEGNDLGRSSATFARRLREKGYDFVGGMVNDGAGWASWRNRTDRVFETLFPLTD